MSAFSEHFSRFEAPAPRRLPIHTIQNRWRATSARYSSSVELSLPGSHQTRESPLRSFRTSRSSFRSFSMKFETQACSFSPIKPRMTRRDFIALLGTTAAARPLPANALGGLTNPDGDNREATTRELANNGSTYVYFFGGYRSTDADVQAWGRSVEAKVPGAPAVVYPYPPGASAGDPLAEWGRSQEIATEILERTNEQYIIVGHSSGCAIANDVANIALDLGAKNFKLIALDGF